MCPACGQGQGCMGKASALSEEPTVWEESAPREMEFGDPGHDRVVSCVCVGGKGSSGRRVGGGVKAAKEGVWPTEGWEIRDGGLKVRDCGDGGEGGVHVHRILDCER